MSRVVARAVRFSVVATAFAALPAMGQISTNTPPEKRTLPLAKEVEQDMESARFRLGPVRLAPFFRLENVGWSNNALVTSEGMVDDYTASVSAGAKLILPLGRKGYLRGNVAPTYDWYYRSEALRGWGGSYDAELLGLFNRLTLGTGGGYTERISTVSSEVARDVLNTTATGSAKAEVRLLDRLSLFAGAETAQLKQTDPSASTPGLAPVSDLDRKETAYRVGVRYGFTANLSFGIMGEEVDTRFDTNPTLRDNDVRGLLFVTRYDRERFYLEGTVGLRDGKPVTPNEYFPAYQELTYGYFASFFVTRPLELQVLGHRRPEASLFLDNPYYFTTQNGLRLKFAIGRRLSLLAEGELGSNRYVNPVQEVSTGNIVVRRDDTFTFGGGFDFGITRAMSVSLKVSRDRYDSNIDYYDRKLVRIYGGLAVVADFGR